MSIAVSYEEMSAVVSKAIDAAAAYCRKLDKAIYEHGESPNTLRHFYEETDSDLEWLIATAGQLKNLLLTVSRDEIAQFMHSYRWDNILRAVEVYGKNHLHDLDINLAMAYLTLTEHLKEPKLIKGMQNAVAVISEFFSHGREPPQKIGSEF